MTCRLELLVRVALPGAPRLHEGGACMQGPHLARAACPGIGAPCTVLAGRKGSRHHAHSALQSMERTQFPLRTRVASRLLSRRRSEGAARCEAPATRRTLASTHQRRLASGEIQSRTGLAMNTTTAARKRMSSQPAIARTPGSGQSWERFGLDRRLYLFFYACETAKTSFLSVLHADSRQ